MVTGRLKIEVGFVASGLHKVLDLLPGNQHFSQGAATGQLAPGNQPTHGFGAYIQGCRCLVNVIKQGIRERGSRHGIGHFRSLNFSRFHGQFFVFLFHAVIGDAPFFANLLSDSTRVVSECSRVVSEFAKKPINDWFSGRGGG